MAQVFCNFVDMMIGNLKKASYFILMLVSIAHTCKAETPEFRPRTVIPRAFPAIVDPKIVSANQADDGGLVRDRELVLGVVIDGDARAYPINTLTGPQREIINDKLGERSIAATW